jgi:hypothetical protein
VAFVARTAGASMSFSGHHTAFRAVSGTVTMTFDGGQKPIAARGESRLTTRSNYFIGNDRERWLRDVPNFGKIRFSDVYPGVDQVFYGNGTELEYDLVVSPGTDVKNIRLRFDGAHTARIDESGNLLLGVGEQELQHKRPIAYQEISGARNEIAAEYSLSESQGDTFHVGFVVADHDRSLPLVIDPVVSFSTFLGGSASDTGRAIAIDNDKNVYVAGNTLSTDFPLVNPVQSANTSPATGDVFVAKISADGSQLIYATHFGGNVGDIAHAIDVDGVGHAYVAGVTGGTLGSNTFPTTAAAFDRNFTGPDEAFLFKLNGLGNEVVYSTYTGAAIAFGIKVDRTTQDVYLAGSAGPDLPTTAGAFRTQCPISPCISNAYVTKFGPTGGDLIYSTYIGPGTAHDLAVDALGNAYITGSTISTSFPITAGAAQPSCAGCDLARSDAFATKLNADGTALVFSTYLGGSLNEVGTGIAVDLNGNAHITGRTESSSSSSNPFPTTAGAFQTTSAGIPDGFVTKINSAGSAFIYSTYLGGGVRDEASDIAVDDTGVAHIIGLTRSVNFPLADPVQPSCTGNGECAFFSSLNEEGSALLFSTFYGQGQGLEIVVDRNGAVYGTGASDPGLTDPPLVNPLQGVRGGSTDAFVAKIPVTNIQRATVTGRVTAPDGRPLQSVLVTITDSSGRQRTTLSSNFGFYRFDEAIVPRSYIVTARSKRFRFAVQRVHLTSDNSVVNFVGLE